MGGKQSTVQNLQVLRIDTASNLIFVQGAVPGPDQAYVRVRDALKIMVNRPKHSSISGKGVKEDKIGAAKFLPEGVDDLPFPAGTRKLANLLPPVVTAKVNLAPTVT